MLGFGQWENIVKSIACLRLSKNDGVCLSWSEIVEVLDGKMCDVGPHHRLRCSYSPTARREALTRAGKERPLQLHSQAVPGAKVRD